MRTRPTTQTRLLMTFLLKGSVRGPSFKSSSTSLVVEPCTTAADAKLRSNNTGLQNQSSCYVGRLQRAVFFCAAHAHFVPRDNSLNLRPFSLTFGLKALSCRIGGRSMIQFSPKKSKNYVLRPKRRRIKRIGHFERSCNRADPNSNELGPLRGAVD